MNRRGFIGSLLAAATLDPERLLWVPGAKHISIPKKPVFCIEWSYGMIEKVHSDYAEWKIGVFREQYLVYPRLPFGALTSSMMSYDPLSFYNGLLTARPVVQSTFDSTLPLPAKVVRKWIEYE